MKFIYKDDNTDEIRCVVSDTPQTAKTLELVKLGKSSDGQIWEKPVEKTDGAITKLSCEMPHPQAAFIVDCKGIGIELKTLMELEEP
ncbi:hypothetical protein MHLP_00815 [Candidatus Mycoplasma haematolamae str. Purdue]|uniref:Uncharacterized protein n=1 Tax=Mycoplasma haematolamae (strain Purdue) TaxID=1212765 RepID=I7BIU0_MYCHA|nr:hypothetical protein [Candidatus Mycoplasma haematolamae]AFO51743.1 hypothetical protein MHLP_00815 [Candidatus Mycoplasma haematolamae str. Purdue]